MAEICMKSAYEKGIYFFDNAESYATVLSKIIMGNVLKKLGWRRDSYKINRDTSHFLKQLIFLLLNWRNREGVPCQ